MNQETRKLRVGVLGCGPVSQAAHFIGCRKAHNAELYAICDQAEDLVNRMMAVHEPQISYLDYDQMLADPQVEAIIVAIADQFHVEAALKSIASGKHVLVEKPLTTCVAEAEELIALADQQQRVLTVGHTFLYSPAVNELRKMIQSGDLGKIYCVEAERVNLGLYRNDINVIWDLAPHDISILLYLFDKEPEQIKVQAHAHLRSRNHDIAHLDLGYDDGMAAHILVSWLHPCPA